MEGNSTSKKLINSAMLVMIITVLAKIFGFAREVAMGSVFGTGEDSNIYFWAIGISVTIYMSFATAVSTSILPTLKEYKVAKLLEKSNKYFSKIVTLMLLISMLVATVLIFTAPGYVSMIATKYHGKSLQKAILITQILTPSLLFIMLTYITKTILQANEKFFIYSIISLPYNIFLLIYLQFFSKTYGIYGLAVSTTFAWLLQFLIQLPVLIRLKVKYKLDFKFKDQDVKKFAVLIFPLLISTLVYSVNTLVDKSIALNLTEGKVSGLSYGYTIYASIATTIILSITTVLYPRFIESNLVSSSEKFREEVSKIMQTMIYIGLPLMVSFITLNKEIVELVYMRGEFNADSVELTRWALVFYSMGALGYTLQDIVMKVFYSLNESKIPMITSIITVIVNVILDLVLVNYFDYRGLALATSIAITLNALIMFVCLEGKIGALHKKNICITLTKCSLALIPAVFAARIIINKLFVEGHRILLNISVLLFATVVAGLMYLIFTYLLNVSETKFIVKNYLRFGGDKSEKR